MTWTVAAGFLAAVLPLVLTPGASLTLATQRALAGERRATARVIAGTATGIYCHALLAAAGLSAVVMRSAEAFSVIKVVGGIYLVWLGFFTLRRGRPRGTSPGRGRRLPWAGHGTFRQAVLANVLNPKAASVYLTLAPQFLTVEHVGAVPMLTLATVHVLAMAAWLTTWSMMLGRASRHLGGRSLRAVVDRVGAAVLIALGVRTVTAA